MLKKPKLSKKTLKVMFLMMMVLITISSLLNTDFALPVDGMTKSSYNQKSFWYYPWGKSVTHKGVDIFATKGTSVLSSTNGLVLMAGTIKLGGNVVLVLDRKLRLHYYAHLNKIETKTGRFVGSGQIIGTVGDTGNARGKPYHLHYSIMTLIPHPWRIDTAIQGWKKMFYLNPIRFINAEF